MIKTLAQAKRDFTVGKRIKLTQHNIKPERIGLVFEIMKVQKNAIAYQVITDLQNTCLVWHEWCKSSNYIYNDKKLTFINPITKQVLYEYEVL